MRFYMFLIVFEVGLQCVHSFWPPAYKVDLNDRKVFIISSEDGIDYDDESEMIQDSDLAQFESFANEEDKYKPLHSHVEHYNKLAARTATEFAKAFPMLKSNLEDIHNFVEEAKPFVAGFKHKFDEYDFDDLEERVFGAVKKRRNISTHLAWQTPFAMRGKTNSNFIPSNLWESFSTMKNDAIRQMRQIADQEHEESSEGTIKTYNNHSEKVNVSSEQQSPDKYDYDYHLFKSEYLEQLEFSKMDNNTFNFTENEVPEESGEDALKKIINFKMPRNCTREELTEFGARALECLAFDYKHTKDKKNLKRILYRTWTILRIWICIYLCIAIICWCQKGWCCCCFNCAYCDPMDKILTAKKYYAENPPGILTEYADSNGAKDAKTTEFEPTLFELEAYEKFESAMRNL